MDDLIRRGCELTGIEAAIWSWLSLSFPHAKLVKLLVRFSGTGGRGRRPAGRDAGRLAGPGLLAPLGMAAMANLAIAGVCNLRCPYCFAGSYLATSRDQGAAFVDAAAFEERLDFLERSGIPEARLIGGEPTLHPAFPDLVVAARSRGLRIPVFSHGLMPRRAWTAWPSCRPTCAPYW